MTKKSIAKFFPSLSKEFVLSYKVILIALIFFGLLFLHSSVNREEDLIRSDLTTSANKIEKIIMSDLDHIKYQIYYAARQIRDVDAEDDKVKKILSDFVTGINSQFDLAISWNAFSWIDRQDHLILDGDAGLIERPVDMVDRDYLQLTKIYPDRLFIGESINGALSRREIIPVGLGVFSHKGSYLGTLVFGFDVDRIIAKIEREIGNETIGFMVLNDSKPSFHSNKLSQNDLKFTKNLLIDKKYSYKNEMINNQGVFLKNRPFIYSQTAKNYDLKVVTIYDKNKSHKKIVNALLRSLFLMSIIILSCIALFWHINRKIIKPVSNLSKFAAKISEKDFSVEIEKPTSIELIELYETLNMVKNSFKKEKELMKQLEVANGKVSEENFNKSEFLAAISHDIRNPISAIISFAYLIHDSEKLTIKEIKDLAHDIDGCANEVMEFINDLMDINQGALGEFSIDLSHEIDIVHVVQRAIRVNRDFAAKRKIEIISKIEKDMPKIILDERRVKQILVNLISNSIKYSKEKTKIEVFLTKIKEKSKEKLQIIVKDYGFGMSKEQIKIALKKYGKVENENSKIVDSFGLGLHLVKRLVEKQNGEMVIESEVGVGTKVILTFDF